jgi:hypothetical protein
LGGLYLGGLYSGGLIFGGGAYVWNEVSVSICGGAYIRGGGYIRGGVTGYGKLKYYYNAIRVVFHQTICSTL